MKAWKTFSYWQKRNGQIQETGSKSIRAVLSFCMHKSESIKKKKKKKSRANPQRAQRCNRQTMLYPRTLTKRKQVDSLKAVFKRSKLRGLHKKRLKTLAMWLRNKRIKCTTKLNWEGLYVCAKPLQSCQALCDPTDCSPPGSSVHGILHARILEWTATCSSRGSSRPRNWTHMAYISCIGRRVLYH